ncbi:PASTA domain-containing protein [Streptomyces sp. NPDC006173]|uniref:PASTA domain-containing protein n=1 Tax=Streptomyces sp. NPDC006173 TaxID=3155349 RepID=UPI0033E4097E
MHTRIVTAILACIAAPSLAACQPASQDVGAGAPTSSAGRPAKSTTTKMAVPNFDGIGLQPAQDKAQSTGFFLLTSHDAAGRDRMQVFDRDWKVCFQSVAAGKKVPTTTMLNFGAVKTDESCPSADNQAPKKAAGTMPNFKGKSVKAARGALDSGTSITVKDASGQDRIIFLESNWQVCSQTPAAGSKITGQPVEFIAVKFGENCP